MRECDGGCLEEVLEERQNDENGVGRNEANAVTSQYVRCDEIRLMVPEITTEMRVLDASESSNSWISWRRRILRNHPGAYHRLIDQSSGSCSSGYRPQSGLRPVSRTFEEYSTSSEFWKVPSKAPWRHIVKGRERKSRPESLCHPLTPCSHLRRIRSKPVH